MIRKRVSFIVSVFCIWVDNYKISEYSYYRNSQAKEFYAQIRAN